MKMTKKEALAIAATHCGLSSIEETEILVLRGMYITLKKELGDLFGDVLNETEIITKEQLKILAVTVIDEM